MRRKMSGKKPYKKSVWDIRTNVKVKNSGLYLEFYISFLLQLWDMRYGIIHTAILTRLLQRKKRQKFIIDELNMSHFYVSLRWIITSSVELFIGSLDLAAALPVELPFSSFTLATKT